MIVRPIDGGHDPRPLTATGLARLVAAAATVVVVQASLVDSITSPVLGHLDLPLVAASVLVLARPNHSTVIGLVFGLMVDASAQRLFGLHCIAYAALGPVARSLPTPALSRRGALIAWRAGAQGLAVVSIAAAGGAIAAGGPPPGVVGQALQSAALVGLVAIPVSRLVGVDVAIGGSRAVWSPVGRRGPGRPRSGILGPLVR